MNDELAPLQREVEGISHRVVLMMCGARAQRWGRLGWAQVFEKTDSRAFTPMCSLPRGALPAVQHSVA